MPFPIRWWPRTIRWQMLAGLLLLETLSIGLFAIVLSRQQTNEVYARARVRLAYEATSVALQSSEALLQNRPGWVGLSVRMIGEAPTVAFAKVTDPAGNVLFVSKGEADQVTLNPTERAQLLLIRRQDPIFFVYDGSRWESAAAIYTGTDLRGYAWVEYRKEWSREQLDSLLSATFLFGIIWMLASAVLVLLMARSISRPLAQLQRGTRALMTAPEGSANFPLQTGPIQNEIGDLIEAFNRMVASLAEQRSGLNDTLSLLDSMLANAPIGLAFFDRECRFTRVNQVFADLTGVSPSRHLGRTLPELFPAHVAQQIENAVQRVFAEQESMRSFELTGQGGANGRPWTWLVSAYPVRTTPRQIRWAGIIVLDASDRKRSEESLRKAEKLAVTGRLAASIAHEINNPLEAITNLLFLLRNYCDLHDPALNYVTMAEYEVRRIAEITQQTLRFYRQPTLPARTKMSELLDSVLSLYQGRVNSLNIRVERKYDADLDLFCFAGEIRQVFANLVGNSIDASSAGGRLLVRARRSRNWKHPQQTGVRFTTADTGAGMEAEARKRAFEAFFTTKEVTGTGLGLWVSSEIINKHHGTIQLRSRTASSGRPSGTVFQFFIPDDPTLLAATDVTQEATVNASA
jgi:PAS domain S-box-containing protein